MEGFVSLDVNFAIGSSNMCVPPFRTGCRHVQEQNSTLRDVNKLEA